MAESGESTGRRVSVREADGAYVPVGTIVAYAGPDPKALEPGWLLCDGRELVTSEHQELATALGTASGGTDTTFLLPELCGRFVRGTDHGKRRDPDADRRGATAAGGNAGDAVGSLQEWATGRPDPPTRSAFLENLPTKEHGALEGGSGQAKWNGGTRDVDTNGGGDHETRPTNRSAHCVVKATSSVDGVPVTLPLAAVMPYPGKETQDLTTHWVRCDDTLYATTGALKDLFKVLDYRYGGSGAQFGLPDDRGLFLRGADAGSQNDPDWTERLGHVEVGPGADDVGSLQEWATARPRTAFRSAVPHLPTGGQKMGNMWGTANASWPGKTIPLDVSAGGGALETRPINGYYDFYVLGRTAPPGADPIPLGSIIMIIGAAPDPALWRLCDGTGQPVSGNEALFGVLGYAHGGGDGWFLLPDLCGRFVRGVDHGAGRDPDAATREEAAPGGNTGDAIGSVQGWATARPHNAFTADVPNVPDDYWQDAALTNSYSQRSDGAAFNTNTLGGDAETRPVNVYADFYIRVASPEARS
jgi:microcystin-dependent protein